MWGAVGTCGEGGRGGRGADVWPGRLTVLPDCSPIFPLRTYVLPKGRGHCCSLLTPEDCTTDVCGGGRVGENRCAVKGEGGYIQADQTKWPLMLSLLVLNQMTLQQELLTRVHTSVSVCVCGKSSI